MDNLRDVSQEKIDELYQSASKLLFHRSQNTLHPIDFQRLKQAIDRINKEMK